VNVQWNIAKSQNAAYIDVGSRLYYLQDFFLGVLWRIFPSSRIADNKYAHTVL
jgi:hypothetical protein